MKTIYRNNSILHGCDEIESIFKEATRIARKHNKIEGIIFLVGQYALKMQSSWVRYYWNNLRRSYLLGDLFTFRLRYNQFCNMLASSLGCFAWSNTITF